ncbi:very short patch repair endonuclease [Balneolales bacterium ANBcel1]|nr:very short patch repair endonuclease [Balneolales bacterium ANBcel1]
MSKIRSKNTKPEITLRSALHQLGYRFRVHKKDLPGNPDIVLPKYNTIIFVNGCFWHYHKDCREGRIPNTNTKFWKEKLKRNVERDKKNQAILKKNGWRVIVFWECDIENEPEIIIRKVLQSLKTD